MGKPTRYESPRDDTASSSSAVLLDNIDYHEDEEEDHFDEDLPAYEDLPAAIRPNAVVQRINFLQRPKIPESATSSDRKSISTLSPQYTRYADSLEELVTTQAQYPPVLTLNIQGTHRETKNKESKSQTVTDFDFNLDMSHLLIPLDGSQPGGIEMIPEDMKAYRGTRRPTETKIVDIEAGNDLATWCTRYCQDPSSVKSFALKRNVIGLNEARLTKSIEGLIRSTNYLGYIHVTYPVTAKNVVVYSPGKINRLRTLWYVRWFFYLTFLWIFTWPYLFFVTKRYEVVKADFYFAHTIPCSDDTSKVIRKFTSMSEDEYFRKWKAAIKRAALGRMKGCIDEEYLKQSIRLETGTPNTGNAIADTAVRFLQQAMVVGRDINNMGGWGGNS